MAGIGEGYVWREGGRIVAVAMTPDLTGVAGERVAVPGALALALLCDAEPVSRWTVATDGALLRIDDPALFAPAPGDGGGPSPQHEVAAAGAADAARWPVRLRLRVGARARVVRAALEADGWFVPPPVEALECLPPVVLTGVSEEGAPLFARDIGIADLVAAGAEGLALDLPEDAPMDGLVLFASALRGCGVRRTEDGDDLPLARRGAGLSPDLILADRIAPGKEPPPGLLLDRGKRGVLAVSVHDGGGRRHANPPATLPLVLTEEGDPSAILLAAGLDTVALLAGKTLSVKLPPSVSGGRAKGAPPRFDALVGRLFERAALRDDAR